LLLLRWVFVNDFGDDEALTEAVQSDLENDLLRKNQEVWVLESICWPWTVAPIQT
jgi:hypothetical protein